MSSTTHVKFTMFKWLVYTKSGGCLGGSRNLPENQDRGTHGGAFIHGSKVKCTLQTH